MDRDYADNHRRAARAAVRACALRQEPGDERGHLARGRRCRPQVACDRLRPAARARPRARVRQRRRRARHPAQAWRGAAAGAGRDGVADPRLLRPDRQPARAPSSCAVASKSAGRSRLADRRTRAASAEGHRSGALTGPQVSCWPRRYSRRWIALELPSAAGAGADTYRLADALSSIGLGIMARSPGCSCALHAGHHLRHQWAWRLPADSAEGLAGALIAYDFCYYGTTAPGTVRRYLFWASLAVHHPERDYNLSTALRQTSGGHGRLDLLPADGAGRRAALVLAGRADRPALPVSTAQYADRAAGWFDRWFCAPQSTARTMR